MSEKFVLFDSRMGDKTNLSDFFSKHLIDICKGEIEAGNRPLGLFTSTDWKNHVSKFEERTSDKNKLDNKKRIWMVQGVQELCHRTWMGRGKGNC